MIEVEVDKLNASTDQEHVNEEMKADVDTGDAEESHNEDQPLEVTTAVVTENDADPDERSTATSLVNEDEDEEESKSAAPTDEAGSPKAETADSAPESKKKKKKKKVIPPSSRKGRAPAVKGLTIPFRTVKKVRDFLRISSVLARWDKAFFLKQTFFLLDRQ